MPSNHSQLQRTTGYETLSPLDSLEGFHYDPRIFGYPSQNLEDVPDFYMHRIDPLPDSPPELIRCNWRRRGEYLRKGTSR